MPWIVGVDEAGYGPNLGPLVMTSAAIRIEEETPPPKLWESFATAVRRNGERADCRIIVDDSKLVYSSTRGLEELETSVLAVLHCCQKRTPSTLRETLGLFSPESLTDLGNEVWYTGNSIVPIQVNSQSARDAADLLGETCKQNRVASIEVRSRIVCTSRFNGLLDEWESKGAVLSQTLKDLLEASDGLDGAEPVSFFVDKHGGRNTYGPMMQDAFPSGMVMSQQESLNRSVYNVFGLGRDTKLTFQPRADAEHFCVALASMISKYFREALMLEFNAYWQQHLPGLKPTAGYPVDAQRFLTDITPIMKKLSIAKELIWRRK